MRRWFALFAGLALVASTSQLQAQPGIPFNAGPGIAATLNMNQLMMQPVRESVAQTMNRSARGTPPARYAARPAGAAFAAGAPTSAVAGASTAYRPSPEVTSRVKQQYVAFVGKTVSPQAAKAYEDVLARRDFVSNWAQLVAPEGLRPGDAVDAFAAYWMLNYLIANGLTDSGAGSGRAVADQLRGIFLSNPAFARLNEGQRQEMAEVLMLNFLTQQAAYDHAVTARNEDLKRKLGEAAVTRFRNEMGVDLRQLRLTRTGFSRGG